MISSSICVSNIEHEYHDPCATTITDIGSHTITLMPSKLDASRFKAQWRHCRQYQLYLVSSSWHFHLLPAHLPYAFWPVPVTLWRHRRPLQLDRRHRSLQLLKSARHHSAAMSSWRTEDIRNGDAATCWNGGGGETRKESLNIIYMTRCKEIIKTRGLFWEPTSDQCLTIIVPVLLAAAEPLTSFSLAALSSLACSSDMSPISSNSASSGSLSLQKRYKSCNYM